MRHNGTILLIAIGTLIGASAPLTALAATQKPKMTCQDFLALDEVSRPKVVYWADGYNRFGISDNGLVDVVENDRVVPVLIEECTKTPDHLIVEKVKEVHKKIKG